MWIAPVLDIRSGTVVHAVRGERARYAPVRSILTESVDPVDVARALWQHTRASWMYVADLDAIEHGTVQWDVLKHLVRAVPVWWMVDAGVTDDHRARELRRIGVHTVIVAAERIESMATLDRLAHILPEAHRLFSLDMRGSRIDTRASALARLSPPDACAMLHARGWYRILLLDLNRVGTGQGPDTALITRIRRRFPDIELWIGGGIRNREDIRRLHALGVHGVLVATALHRGWI